MNDYYEDSYCGLFCGACEILNAHKRSLETGEEPVWDAFPEPIKNHIKPAKIECLGCKSDVVFEGCRKCQIRECARNYGVEFCSDCSNYPCGLVRNMKKGVDSLKKSLPHVRFIINNLEDITKEGKTAWLTAQNEYWKCENCSMRLTWYQEKCPECGLKVKLRYFD